MSLNLVNIGLVIGVLLALVMAILGLQAWRTQRTGDVAEYARMRATRQIERAAAEYRTLNRSNPPLYDYGATYGHLYLMRKQKIARLFLFLNAATTLAALIPLGFAMYSLIANQQHQALNFNLAAIATLIVTKGRLFLLTWILLPAAKAIHGAVTGAIIKGVYDDRRKRKEKKASD